MFVEGKEGETDIPPISHTSISMRDKKALLSDQCKEIEDSNRIGKTQDLFKKIRDKREYFIQVKKK